MEATAIPVSVVVREMPAPVAGGAGAAPEAVATGRALAPAAPA
jgi:hypothetical protein